VRKAFSLTTDEEQNQCCWQGRHELQVHDHINSIEDVQVAPSQVIGMQNGGIPIILVGGIVLFAHVCACASFNRE